MLLEALLAYAHIGAILGLVVFMTSQAALCRVEWMNAAVVHRLGHLDRLTDAAALTVLATGLARAWWGVKGWDWYWTQPLLHLKLTVFIVIGAMAIPPARAYRRWRAALAAGQGPPPGRGGAPGAPLGHDPGPCAVAAAAGGHPARTRPVDPLTPRSP
jgi:putative membrane protein